MPISNFNCKYRSLLICIVAGLVLFIYGLANLPDPGTRTTINSESEPPNNQSIIVNSSQFKMSIGGLGLAIVSMLLFAKLSRDREIEEIEEDERKARRAAQTIVRVAPEPLTVVRPLLKPGPDPSHKPGPAPLHETNPEPLQDTNPVQAVQINNVVSPDIKQKETRVTFKEPLTNLPRGPSIMYLPRPWLPPNYQYRPVPYPNVIPIPRPLINIRPPTVYTH